MRRNWQTRQTYTHLNNVRLRCGAVGCSRFAEPRSACFVLKQLLVDPVSKLVGKEANNDTSEKIIYRHLIVARRKSQKPRVFHKPGAVAEPTGIEARHCESPGHGRARWKLNISSAGMGPSI